MKMKKILSACMITVLCACVAITTGCAANSSKKDDATESVPSYVTLTANTASYELVCDASNNVVAVNGLNDEAKMLLSGENYKNMPATEVCAALTELSFKDDVEGLQNVIVDVAASIEAAAKKFAAEIKVVLETKFKNNPVTVKVEQIKAQKKLELIQKIQEVYPELTLEQLSALDDEQLFALLNVTIEQKALMPTMALEQKLIDFKQVEFKFKYHTQIDEEISKANGYIYAAYKMVYADYKNVYTQYQALEEQLINGDNSIFKANEAKIAECEETLATYEAQLQALATNEDYTNAVQVLKDYDIVRAYPTVSEPTEEQTSAYEASKGRLEAICEEQGCDLATLVSNSQNAKTTVETNMFKLNVGIETVTAEKTLYESMNASLKEAYDSFFGTVDTELGKLDAKLTALEESFKEPIKATEITTVEEAINNTKNEACDRYIAIFGNLIKSEQDRIAAQKDQILNSKNN